MRCNQFVVVFRVQEYPVKPVSMKGKYYRRQANSNHLLSASEIADLSLQSRNLSWDSYPRIGTRFEDLSEEKIKDFKDKGFYWKGQSGREVSFAGITTRSLVKIRNDSGWCANQFCVSVVCRR